MDVNGFVMHLKEAMKMETADMEFNKIKTVSLKSLQSAFKNFKSWNDLNNIDSEFVAFLNKNCKMDPDEAEDQPENVYSVHKIRILGILWCDGDAKEKAIELYDVISNQEYLTWGDKDFKPTMTQLFSFATTIIHGYFKDEPNAPELPDGAEDLFDSMCEEFLDNIFEYESRVEKAAWIKHTAEKQSYIFNPKLIREKLI